MEPPPRKTSSDPLRPTSDADAATPDVPESSPGASSVLSSASQAPAEGRPAIRLQDLGRDLTPQEWEDFIRQHGSAMLPPDGEG
jgi:hypothetical protein